MLIAELFVPMLCMTDGVVYMHKWHIRAAQKYQRNMYVSLRTQAQIGVMEKQKQTKKVFFLRIWDVGFPV
jgi:hypothetical protein